MKSEERDLSFAEFGPKRPYTAPGEIEADERIAQPLEIIGGPSGTRTLDHRVKSPTQLDRVSIAEFLRVRFSWEDSFPRCLLGSLRFAECGAVGTQ